jgi:carnitine-CoA ligase
MLEYNGNLEATRDKWRNLWLHTGDMVRQDEEGQYFFVDRNNDAIRRRGENISSYEVEVEMRGHPEVMEVAAIGVASVNYESEVMVFVKLIPDAAADPAELQGFLKGRLPYFMVPRYVEIVDEFEKTMTQRINKAVLREAGVGPRTWDAREFGLEATRND